MFKQAAYAVAAASAFVAAPASAAITVSYPAGQVVILTPDGFGEAAGNVNFRVSALASDVAGSFQAIFTFNNTFFDPARAVTSLIFASNDADSISYTAVDIDGVAGTFQGGANNGNNASLVTWNDPISLGVHTLNIFGTFNPAGNDNASSGGTLTLNQSAVPEPATWALFILGFGTLGHTMRRRSSKVKIAKASLSFA